MSNSRKMKTPKQIMEEFRESLLKMKPDGDSLTAFHKTFRKVADQFDTPGPEMKSMRDVDIPTSEGNITARLYEPFDIPDAPGATFIYLHGGGFVSCDVDTHDGICRRVASGGGMRVLSVEYRLAPEFPFPAAVDDCEAALKWALDGRGLDHGIEPKNLALGGDSAGGNMTAYLTQKYRQDLRAQVLYYPLMQMAEFKPVKPGPQDMLQLGVIALKFIDEHYVVDADPLDPRLSPLFEKDLVGIPPTFLLTCGLDPLRQEGKAYGEKLRAAGVKVTDVHESLMPHGFLNFARAFPRAKKIPLDTADFLREYLQFPEDK